MFWPGPEAGPEPGFGLGPVSAAEDGANETSVAVVAGAGHLRPGQLYGHHDIHERDRKLKTDAILQ